MSSLIQGVCEETSGVEWIKIKVNNKIELNFFHCISITKLKLTLELVKLSDGRWQ